MPKAVWPPTPKLHKPSGRARLRWLGVEYYLGPWGSAEASLAYADWLRKHGGEGGSAPTPSVPPTLPNRTPAAWPTIAEALVRWEAAEGGKFDPAGHSLRHYLGAFRPVLLRFGVQSTAAFTLDALAQAREDMRALDWSARVINRRVVRIRTVWRWFEEQRLAPAGSWGALSVLRPIQPGDHRYRHLPAVRGLTQGEYELVLLGCHPVLLVLVEVHWLTGMRSGELVAMQAGDIDREGDIWVYRPRKHKNAWRGHDRLVPLGPRCQQILTPWLEGKSRDAWVFPCHRGAKRTDHPWSWRKRIHGLRAYSVESYAQAFGRAADWAGVWGARPYMLRHAAKARITAEYGLDHARALLGQASVDATARYASQRDLDTASEIARRCG